MTKIYNLPFNKDFRRELRKNMTRPEMAIWFQLRNRQFYGIKFRRQYGVWIYVIDFYVPQIKFGIELDGDSHSENPEYEKARTDFIEMYGIILVRYTNRDVLNNMEWVFSDIAWRLGINNLP